MKSIAVWLLASFGLVLVGPAQAEVARFEILERGPAFGGASFDKVGAYERITARATLAVDPADRRNAVIADLDQAPRNGQGRVEAVADVFILRPADPARANGAVIVEVPNRGRELMLHLFAEAVAAKGPPAMAAEAAGNGFLFREGYTLAWVGWQADIPSEPGRLALRVPVLAGVTGPVRDEVVFDHLKSPATTALPWPVADARSLKVTVRAGWEAARQSPAGLAWRLLEDGKPEGGKLEGGKLEITRPAGFDAGAIYEITYTAKDPRVVGLGFAALRDVASFLRHEAGAANPLAGQVRRSHLFGVSQSGRYVRDYLYLGFNEDLAGRRVFDGMMPHVAGGRRLYGNSRFAQPGRAPRYPHDVAWPADAFPFTYADTTDPVSGVRDSLMRSCRATGTCPKVMQTDTETEYWGARASLVVTDPAGRDLVLPDDVRAYMISGTPHFSAPRAEVRKSEVCALPVNPLHAGAPMRALLSALDGWTSRRRPAARRAAPTAPWWHRTRRCPTSPASPTGACTCRRPRSTPPASLRATHRASSAATPCWCRSPMPTAWRWPASACRRSRCRAPPTPPGTRVPRVLARARSARCWAASGRSPRRAPSASATATRGPRSRSATRRRRPTPPRCARPRCGWSRSACC